MGPSFNVYYSDQTNAIKGYKINIFCKLSHIQFFKNVNG